MKISTLDLAPLRASAEARVDAYFAGLARVNAHRDQAHREKRRAAELASERPEAFATLAAEAELIGVAPRDLAATILAKPDDFAARELRRRQLKLRVRNGSAADIQSVLQELDNA